MNIIIVGSGKVGYTLAEQLVREKHDVTVVDVNEDTLRRASDVLDVMTVRGNGVSSVTLNEAGARHADMLVAATNSDEVNMVCSLLAKNLGAKYTAARIRNPDYTTSLAELRANLKIDYVINPESATANEISRLLRFPSATNVETFCRGRVEMMGFRLQKDDFLVDKPLSSLSREVKQLDLLVAAAERNGEAIIPNGSFVPLAGDKLYLVGRPTSLDNFFRLLGRYAPKAKRIMIVGGGKISTYLASILSRRDIKIKIIEQNEARCRVISEHHPSVTVICGDGTDQELLDSENLSKSDAFVALTGRDEDNLIMSLHAAQEGLQKVITKCNRQNYAGVARAAGLDTLVSPKYITASYILRIVRGMQNSRGSVMNSLYRIADGGAEAMEFDVSASTRYLGIPFKSLPLKAGVLIAVIVRGHSIIIPEGSSCLQTHDIVIIISRDQGIRDLNDIFSPDVPDVPAVGGAI